MNLLRRCPRPVLQIGALSLLVTWLGWLAYNSFLFAQRLDETVRPGPLAVSEPPRLPPNNAAIAQLFGVLPQEATGNLPRVPLTLLASLVERRPELSRALIESPEGSRFYGIGEPLPGGGSLREISTQQVRIQRFGEDQSLSLAHHSTPLLMPLPMAPEMPQSTAVRAETHNLVQPSL